MQGGIRLRKFGAGLLELLVQFGCIDLRQELALRDVRANIHEPALEIPVGPGENWRFEQRFDLRRQQQTAGGWLAVGDTTLTLGVASSIVSARTTAR